jgi:hypothetical protein
MDKEKGNTSHGYSKEEVKSYLADIERKLVESSGAYMHSLVALNEILRHPDVPAILDQELKSQLQDIWIKLKSTGIQLADPPLLFGLPPEFAKEQQETSDQEEAEERAEIAASQNKRPGKKELPVGPDGNLIS